MASHFAAKKYEKLAGCPFHLQTHSGKGREDGSSRRSREAAREVVEVTEEKENAAAAVLATRKKKEESKAEQRERELQRDKDEFYLPEMGPHY